MHKPSPLVYLFFGLVRYWYGNKQQWSHCRQKLLTKCHHLQVVGDGDPSKIDTLQPAKTNSNKSPLPKKQKSPPGSISEQQNFCGDGDDSTAAPWSSNSLANVNLLP